MKTNTLACLLLLAGCSSAPQYIDFQIVVTGTTFDSFSGTTCTMSTPGDSRLNSGSGLEMWGTDLIGGQYAVSEAVLTPSGCEVTITVTNAQMPEGSTLNVGNMRAIPQSRLFGIPVSEIADGATIRVSL